MSTELERPADLEAPAPRKRHSLADVYHERTNFQFIDRSWRWASCPVRSS